MATVSIDSLENFNGQPVEIFELEEGIQSTDVAYKIVIDFWEEEETGEDYSAKLEKLCESDLVGELKNLVLGNWIEEYGEDDVDNIKDAIAILIENAEKFTSLEGLMIGDIFYEESELSWIFYDDMSALWAAFPNLKILHVRGAGGLKLGKIKHDNLEKFILESAGTSQNVALELAKAELPKLQYLELWLGDERHADGEEVLEHDLTLIFNNSFPSLKSVAILNSSLGFKMIRSIKETSLINQLTSLDLSGGTLGDETIGELLDENLQQIDTLDISLNYFSNETVQKLQGLYKNVIADGQKKAGKDIKLEDCEDEDDFFSKIRYERYIEIGE